MDKMRITVLKRTVNQDVIEAHMGEISRSECTFPCPVFEDGQIFDMDLWSAAPEGFCGNAWSDIQKHIHFVRGGGTYPRDWVMPEGAAIGCCTDGYRPVVFKIERINETR